MSRSTRTEVEVGAIGDGDCTHSMGLSTPKSQTCSSPIMWTTGRRGSRTSVMARPSRNELAVKSFADAVSALHTQHKRQAGRAASPKDIELTGYARLGMRVSEESIRKALLGQVDPMQCNVELLIVLANFFEVSPDELGTFASERIRRIVAFATPVGPDGGGDMRSAQSRCTAPGSRWELATVTPLRWHQPQLEEAA